MLVLVTPASPASHIAPDTEVSTWVHFRVSGVFLKAPDDGSRPGYVLKAPQVSLILSPSSETLA